MSAIDIKRKLLEILRLRALGTTDIQRVTDRWIVSESTLA